MTIWYGAARTAEQDRILQLETSEWNFFLTGSHYFNQDAEDHGDWDFYIQLPEDPYHLNLFKWLEDLGFEQLFTNDPDNVAYDDKGIIVVYRWHTPVGQQIDIQVVKSAAEKKTVQQTIMAFARDIDFNSMTKKQKRGIWHMVYNTLYPLRELQNAMDK